MPRRATENAFSSRETATDKIMQNLHNYAKFACPPRRVEKSRISVLAGPGIIKKRILNCARAVDIFPTYLRFFGLNPASLKIDAKFDDSGKAANLTYLSTLSYVDTTLEFYYGIADCLMAGIMLPVGYVFGM